MRSPRHLLGCVLAVTRLELLPIRVRRGFARGARWSLYPWTSYWRGTHEPAVQQALESLGEIEGWHCWDLGAHYGLYSIALARRVGAAGSVAAFEPNPLSFRRLTYHRKLNRLNNLRLFCAAVSDQIGAAEFYTYGKLESTTTHLPYADETSSSACAPITVPLVQLDKLVEQGQLRAPDLIKIDVEGHGHKALAGAAQSIAARRPIIFAALHGNPEATEIRSLLDPLGYTETPIGSSEENSTGGDFIFRPPPKRRGLA